jgi:cation diffusion facilitator family transporter
VATDVVVLFGLRLGSKPPDSDHHFGHGRIETLTSALVGAALVVTAFFLGYSAIENIYRHNVYHPTTLAVVAAGVSIIFKEALFHYTRYVGEKVGNHLVVANAWNNRSDAWASAAVLIGVFAARIKPSWHILDPVAALVAAFFIVLVGFDFLKTAFKEISDAAPPGKVIEKIKECSLEVNGVIDVHDLRVRTLGGQYQMEIHIVVNGALSVAQGHKIAKEVESCLNREIREIDKVIVHVDPETLPGSDS